MSKVEEYPKIVISCCKIDYYLTQICVASIRYYYPHVEIFLIKDEIFGDFSTTELEKYFNIEILYLGIKKYGWTTAKMHVLLSSKLKGEKILLLDSDVVFIGKVLDKLKKYSSSADFIVSPGNNEKPGTAEFKKINYDYSWFKKKYPKFKFPGYSFNTGQLWITVGKIIEKDIQDFITFSHYPYWSELAEKHLASRDQALLNFILPFKHQKKQIKIKKVKYMLWSGDAEVKNPFESTYTLENIKNGVYAFIIHWAGEDKTPDFQNMTRKDILFFFQKEYYSSLPFGRLRFMLNRIRF